MTTGPTPGRSLPQRGDGRKRTQSASRFLQRATQSAVNKARQAGSETEKERKLNISCVGLRKERCAREAPIDTRVRYSQVFSADAGCSCCDRRGASRVQGHSCLWVRRTSVNGPETSQSTAFSGGEEHVVGFTDLRCHGNEDGRINGTIPS